MFPRPGPWMAPPAEGSHFLLYPNFFAEASNCLCCCVRFYIFRTAKIQKLCFPGPVNHICPGDLAGLLLFPLTQEGAPFKKIFHLQTSEPDKIYFCGIMKYFAAE